MSTTHTDVTLDRTPLVSLLPLRKGMNIADYHLLLVGEFDRSMVEFVPDSLCQAGADSSAVIFAADPQDPGHSFSFIGCDAHGLQFRAQGNAVWGNYRKVLVFIETAGGIYSFFSDLDGVDSAGVYHFRRPALLYQRKTRLRRRLHLDGQILLRRRSGESITGALHDLSLDGASFFLANCPVDPGESALVEFDVVDCGHCETVVTTVRREARSATLGDLVGVRLLLTKAQRKQVEHLYLCLEYPQLRHWHLDNPADAV
ncbi:PilZ domain-containing protein [Acidithiobacillus sp. AMEEHan]|uniref:PilZ domain-containing protein n=1 Tax=Acidithiobacillus sp. AMEEHan TaxID=2994951 RepID=UPI0027E48705|nr:PilZ domain-containing protein [Acidithiobacillus sp. AMEEHan]